MKSRFAELRRYSGSNAYLIATLTPTGAPPSLTKALIVQDGLLSARRELVRLLDEGDSRTVCEHLNLMDRMVHCLKNIELERIAFESSKLLSSEAQEIRK